MAMPVLHQGALTEVQLAKYLERIKAQLPSTLKPDLQTLRHMLHRHSHSVPFECLSLHHPAAKARSKAPISPWLPDVYEKIVEEDVDREGRGGYCFETNALLGAALRAVGFEDVYHVAARPVIQDAAQEAAKPTGTGDGPEPQTEPENQVQLIGMSHMATIVVLGDEKWVVDAGFGGSSATQPLLLGSDEEVVDEIQNRRHRLRRSTIGSQRTVTDADLAAKPQLARRLGWYLEMEEKPEQEWKPLYFFHDMEATAADFDKANWYTSTNPDSLFVQHLIVTRPTEWGRASIFDKKLRVKRGSQPLEEGTLETQEQLDEALQKYFGIRF